jgi:hypothetical protein
VVSGFQQRNKQRHRFKTRRLMRAEVTLRRKGLRNHTSDGGVAGAADRGGISVGHGTAVSGPVGFEVLNLPSIAQRNETYFLGDGRTYDRQKGELLHSEHETANVLAELKREMGPIAFSAQYQQSPIPPSGAIIKRKWLTPYDDICHPARGGAVHPAADVGNDRRCLDHCECRVAERRCEGHRPLRSRQLSCSSQAQANRTRKIIFVHLQAGKVAVLLSIAGRTVMIDPGDRHGCFRPSGSFA